jgi:polar amino acid transport system substrate-binding protein
MQRFRTLVAVLFIFFLTNMGYCDDLKVITVASEEWENNTNKDETGLYWDIIRKVYQMDNIQLKTRIVPYARSVHMVKVKKVDAWVASYIDEETFAIYPKWHFDADIVSALFQKSKFPDWKGVQSLANKTVGWVRGYDYDQYIDVKMKIDELNSRDSAIGMLVKNRIDVLLDALVEIQNELKKKERLSMK